MTLADLCICCVCNLYGCRYVTDTSFTLQGPHPAQLRARFPQDAAPQRAAEEPERPEGVEGGGRGAPEVLRREREPRAAAGRRKVLPRGGRETTVKICTRLRGPSINSYTWLRDPSICT